MSEKKYILARIGGGRGYTLTDQDLWGLRDALYHGIDSGYFKDNKEWAESMKDKINKLREEEHEL